MFTLLGALIFRPGIVAWDGAAHYAYLRSALIDGDLDFANDLEPVDAQARTPAGRVANTAPVGAAVAWAPWFLAADGVCRAIQVFALCWEGWGWLYVTAICLGTALYGLAGLLLVQRWSSEFASPGAAWAGTLAFWLASPLLVYMYIVPSMPHAIAFAATAAFAACWLPVRARPHGRAWLGWGMLGGLAALVRWQSAVWVVLPLAELWRMRVPLRLRAGLAVALACGYALAFSPQIVAWWRLYGSPLLVPQGQGFLLWDRPEIGAVLFSPLHGLFSWTPLALLGVAGLVCLWRARRDLAVPLVLVFALYVYVNSIVLDWWSGGAFGPRRFIDAFPILILGLGCLFDAVRSRAGLRIALIALCALCAAGQWVYVAEYYAAVVMPAEPLAWGEAIARISRLAASHWLILPWIVGQWHMGPYGTPAAISTYALVFALGGAAVWIVVGRLQPGSRTLRYAVVLAALSVAGLDLFLVNLP